MASFSPVATIEGWIGQPGKLEIQARTQPNNAEVQTTLLCEQFEDLSMEKKRSDGIGARMRPPLSKGPGTLGVTIPVSVNHFPVKIRRQIVYHYDVDVKSPVGPEVQPALFNKIVSNFMAGKGPMVASCPVYDGKKNIYTARKISGIECKREVNYLFEESGFPPREYKVIIQPTGELEVDLTVLEAYCSRNGKASSTDIPLRAIQALDIALKYGARSRRTIIGRNLLKEPEKGHAEDLGGGVELWFGHFQSLRLGWKPFLNVDSSQRAFLKSGLVHEIMADMFNLRVGANVTAAQARTFSRLLNTNKVSYSRGSYQAKVGCNGLKEPANAEKFIHEGNEVTVQQYFEEKYGLKLKYPHLPCVWVGSSKKISLVPMELCSLVPGQEHRRKLTDAQTSKMIRKAAIPTSIRKQRIIQSVKDMNFKEDSYVQQFGIEIDTQMLNLNARVIPKPQLEYGRCKTITPCDGVWNMIGMEMHQTRPLLNYGFLDVSGRLDPPSIAKFRQELLRAAQLTGMTLNSSSLFTRQCPAHRVEDTMIQVKSQFPHLQILFVFISVKNDSCYEVVKSVGDLQLKLVTQCVVYTNILGRNNRGPDPSVMANICLKLNAKLGGVNAVLEMKSRPSLLHPNEQVSHLSDISLMFLKRTMVFRFCLLL